MADLAKISTFEVLRYCRFQNTTNDGVRKYIQIDATMSITSRCLCSLLLVGFLHFQLAFSLQNSRHLIRKRQITTPSFSQSAYTFTVPSCTAGASVGQVFATVYGGYVSNYISGSTSGQYSISSSGLITSNTATPTPETFLVTAYGSSGLPATASVTVVASCTNNYYGSNNYGNNYGSSNYGYGSGSYGIGGRTPPLFQQSSYAFSVGCSSTQKLQVGLIWATNSKSDTLNYSILNGNGSPFSVDSNSGQITSNETLNTQFNWTEEEIDAKVDTVLGNGFAQQLLDIKIYFDSALSGLEKDIKLEMLGQAVLAEFGAIQQRITETQLRFEQWLADPLDIDSQHRFLRAYERNDPEGALHWLHTRLTREGVRRKLIDDIVTKCGRDWKHFAVWEQHICLLVFQACSAELAYLWITDKSKRQSVKNEDKCLFVECEPAKQWTTARICAQSRYVREILAELEYGSLKTKSSFLFTCACIDKKHVDCTVAENGLCSELSVKVCDFVRPLYSGLTLSTFSKLKKEFKATRRIPLATVLRAEYPQFQWSVICLFGELEPAGEHCEGVWNQVVELGSSFLTREESVRSCVSSRGLSYGQLSVTKRVPRQLLLDLGYAITCTVFWTDSGKIHEGRDFVGKMGLESIHNDPLYLKTGRLSHAYDLTKGRRNSFFMFDRASCQDVTFPVARHHRSLERLHMFWPRIITRRNTSS
ncbi:hypothetical protein BV898_13302 [Hypsibius exemplaris]|uniref:Uncharacterized protein n=1 Tax=Hypsibius exemplaris TaxID=2072580 RepID=A0A1W0WB28_HYPEX|nr:hypothetical protein BV898_13302 [Hypsibius exemplaris]